MPISFDVEKSIFSIETQNTKYCFQIVFGKFPVHLYYGAKNDAEIEGYKPEMYSFSPFYAEHGFEYFPDTCMAEYTGFDDGDFRTCSLKVKNANGDCATVLKYKEHRIFNGRLELPGLPFADVDKDCETLEMTLCDDVTGLIVKVYYTVFVNEDIISRYVSITNGGEYTVTISGQSEPFTVTFLKNADEAVADIPEPLKRKGITDISGYYPKRAGYRFMGWSTVPFGEAVETINVKSDINLYAKWSVADFFDFERDGYDEGFVIENGFNKYVLDGVYHAIATDTDFASGNVLTVISPELALDTSDYDGLVIDMQITDFNEGTMLDLKVNTTTGDYYYSYSVASSEFVSYTFDLSDAEGVITGFTLVPVNMDCTVRIDEIAFTKSQSAKKNILRCNNGYASLVCEIDNTDSDGTIAVIAYYEDGRIVKTEIKLLDAESVNTVSSYFATSNDIDTAKVFVLNGFAPIKEPVVITK